MPYCHWSIILSVIAKSHRPPIGRSPSIVRYHTIAGDLPLDLKQSIYRVNIHGTSIIFPGKHLRLSNGPIPFSTAGECPFNLVTHFVLLWPALRLLLLPISQLPDTSKNLCALASRITHYATYNCRK